MSMSMCIMYILWPGIMKLSWVDTEHSQDAGPVLVTGFTEKIAILTRVAPATPPGSEASDLERNILFEKTTLKNHHLVSSASSNGPTLPLILSIQPCSVPEARAFTKNNLYISFPGRAHLLSGGRKHMTSLDGLGAGRRFLTSQLWRNPLSAA